MVMVKVTAAEVVYLQQAAVALLALLQVEVPAASSAQQPLWLRHIKETHPAAVQQTDRQVGLAAAAELLPRQEAGGQRLESQHLTHWRLQVEVRRGKRRKRSRRWRKRRTERKTSRRKDTGLLQLNQTAIQKERLVKGS